MRKYLSYILFGVFVLAVTGLAVSHSRHMHELLENMTHGTPEQRKDAAAELIKAETFSDTITGEPVTVRTQAAVALQDLGTVDAVKQAMSLLKDPDQHVHDQALITLKHIGANSPENVKELMNGLKDGDVHVRKGTVAALADPDGIGPRSSPDVVQAILDIMKKESGARSAGGDVLSSPTFKTNAATTRSIPALLSMLDDKDNGVKQGAADALGKIGDRTAVPKLIALMHASGVDPAVRRVVIGSIALIADRSGEAALTEALDNPNDDAEARAQAASGLGKIATPTATATLIKALNDNDLNIRSSATAGLGRAGKTNKEVLVGLEQALRSPEESVRLGATRALKEIAAPEADSALIQELETDKKSADGRAAAAEALGFPGNSNAVAPLIRALTDPVGKVAAAATKSLGYIGDDAVKALVAVTKRQDADGSIYAYYAAKALGEQRKQALPALEQAARSSNPVTQRWAAVALGESNQPAARPTLEELAKSSDPDVAYVAKAQLSRLGRAQ